MRNLLVAMFCLLFAVSAFAAEFNGIIEVTPADTEAGQTEATVVLDMGDVTYNLVTGDAEKFATLVALEGKALTVTGEVVPAAEGEVMDTLKAESWVESEVVVSDEPIIDEPIIDEPVDEELVDDDAPDAE